MEPIKTGDTVEVVEVCSCGDADYLLGVYTVVETTTLRTHFMTSCGRTDIYTRLALVTLNGIRDYFPVRWLRRVPPLSELEGKETQERKPVKEKSHV